MDLEPTVFVPFLVKEGVVLSDDVTKQHFTFAMVSAPAALGCLIAVFKWDNSDIMKPLRDQVASAWLLLVLVGIISVSLDIEEMPDEFGSFFAVLLTVSALMGVIRSALEWFSQTVSAKREKRIEKGRPAQMS